MEENVGGVRERVADFRKKLIEDAQFRQEFAADPDGTLRASGVSVPAGTVIAPLDAAGLEQRIVRLKAALGEDIEAVYSADAPTSDRLREIMSDARRQSIELHEAELAVVAGGDRAAEGQVTYTISAFGTLDW
jgi:hypothetical protein